MSARRIRPQRGDPLPPDASSLDIAAAYRLSHRQLWRWRQIASLPEDEFEAALAAPEKPTSTSLVDLARRRAGCEPNGKARRRCPHCGGDLP